MRLLRTSIWCDDAFMVHFELVGLEDDGTKRSIRFSLDADAARGFEDKLHHETNLALRNEPRRAG
jgi:hypothetical protein